MDNVRLEGTEYQSITYLCGEALGRNFHVRRSERIRKSPQRYNQGFGADREWKNDAVANILFMNHDRDINSNVDTDDILSLLFKWDVEYCMNMPSKVHMRESYVIKSQSHNPDNTTYMEALSGENEEEYFKAMDDKIQSLIRRDTWEIVLRRSVDDHNVLPLTWYFKCKRKPDWKIRKSKARYFVIGDVQKIFSPKPLNLYSPVVQWVTVKFMLIFQCIIVLQSQSIDFTTNFYQADIPSGEQFFIELPRDFKNDGVQCDVFLKLKKSLYGQS